MKRGLRRRYGHADARGWWTLAEQLAPAEFEKYRDTVAYSGFHTSKLSAGRIRKARASLDKAMTKLGHPPPEAS